MVFFGNYFLLTMLTTPIELCLGLGRVVLSLTEQRTPRISGGVSTVNEYALAIHSEWAE